MINHIIQVLKGNKDITGYKILESLTEENELYFIKKNCDMDRAKKVHYYEITVYVDYIEDGTRYMGSASTVIHPTMQASEIKKAIDEAAFAAKFVKNLYYPLATPGSCHGQLKASNFDRETLSYWLSEIAKAIYQEDHCDKGGINSTEIFLKKVHRHFVNSEGIDVTMMAYESMTEFITNWKEDGEEIELYKSLKFAEFNRAAFIEEVKKIITIAKDRAVAKPTPSLGKISVILTGEAVMELLSSYSTQSNAAQVYNQSSIWKIGDKVQGNDVKGDRITLMLDPFLENSTLSGCFDEDGYPLAPVTILEDGILRRYMASLRYAHYLDVEPTGIIQNRRVLGGKHTVAQLREEPHIEVAIFSDFSMNAMTGDFGGEIRLAWYFDGERTVPVTGGAITGNLYELHQELYLSKELQRINSFEGPKAVKLLKVNVNGAE